MKANTFRNQILHTQAEMALTEAGVGLYFCRVFFYVTLAT